MVSNTPPCCSDSKSNVPLQSRGPKGSLKNNLAFSHPNFRPSLPDPSRLGRDKVLEIAPPLAGWLCNFGSIKSDLNLGANSANLFLSEP